MLVSEFFPSSVIKNVRLLYKTLVYILIFLVRDHGELLVGKCCVTNAGKLTSKYVIHSVGPLYNKYSPSKCDELLQNCILNTLELVK